MHCWKSQVFRVCRSSGKKGDRDTESSRLFHRVGAITKKAVPHVSASLASKESDVWKRTAHMHTPQSYSSFSSLNRRLHSRKHPLPAARPIFWEACHLILNIHVAEQVCGSCALQLWITIGAILNAKLFALLRWDVPLILGACGMERRGAFDVCAWDFLPPFLKP